MRHANHFKKTGFNKLALNAMALSLCVLVPLLGFMALNKWAGMLLKNYIEVEYILFLNALFIFTGFTLYLWIKVIGTLFFRKTYLALVAKIIDNKKPILVTIWLLLWFIGCAWSYLSTQAPGWMLPLFFLGMIINGYLFLFVDGSRD